MRVQRTERRNVSMPSAVTKSGAQATVTRCCCSSASVRALASSRSTIDSCGRHCHGAARLPFSVSKINRFLASSERRQNGVEKLCLRNRWEPFLRTRWKIREANSVTRNKAPARIEIKVLNLTVGTVRGASGTHEYSVKR